MTPLNGTAVFLNDIHVPYQDERALDAALGVIAYLKPESVYLNGDILDFYQLSRFDKKAARVLEFQDDLDELTSVLRAVRDAAPDATIRYMEGNHEHRLARYLDAHPELSSLKSLQIEELLGLGQHKILWVPDSTITLHHNVVVTHGDMARSRAGYTAAGMMDRYGTDGISGHTHRAGVTTRRTLLRTLTWVENGCLCKLDPEYIAGIADWHHAVAVGITTDGHTQLNLIPFVAGGSPCRAAEVVREQAGRAVA